jgi:excisionase family DNA binding protein
MDTIRHRVAREELLLVEEVAQECRVPVSTVRHWIVVGKLKAIKPGRRVLVPRQALTTFLYGGAH